MTPPAATSALEFDSPNIRAALGGFCLALTLGGAVLARLAIDHPTLSAVRILLGFFNVGLAPGLVAVLLISRGVRTPGLQTLGFAAALSLGCAQALAFAGLAGAISSAVLVNSLTAATATGALALLLHRPRHAPRMIWTGAEKWLLLGLLLVAASLYPKGSPFLASSYEDLWHLVPISRLAGSLAPSIDHGFVEPGLVFTHPLSGLHFFHSLVANASGEPPLFVFNKARIYWGFVAPLFLYLTGRRLFAARWAGIAALGAVLLLILAGSLAETKWHWGQAAPVSHNTDIVMGAIVPGIVWLTLLVFQGPVHQRRRAMVPLAGLLVLVTCSHVREAPQIFLYMVAFAVAGLLRRHVALAVRAFGWALSLGAVVFVYDQWHTRHVPQIANHVAEHRAAVEATVQRLHGLDWWRETIGVRPVSVLWEGWHGLLILALPFVLVHGARRREAAGVALGLLWAVILIRVPAFSLAVNWATYDEILMFPVRFFAPFSLLVPGILAWLVALRLARIPAGWRQAAAILGTIAVAWALKTGAEPFLARHPDVFFGFAAVSLLWALWTLLRPQPLRRPMVLPRSGRVTLGLVLLGVAIVTAVPARSPFGWLFPSAGQPSLYLQQSGRATWSWTDIVSNLESIPRHSGTGTEYSDSAPPPPEIIRRVRDGFRPDAVILFNPHNIYPLPAFVPQLAFGWAYLRTSELETPWLTHFKAAGHTPFFTAGEPLADRLRLCRALAVEGILIDPATEAIGRELDENPGTFPLLHRFGKWSIYGVDLPRPP